MNQPKWIPTNKEIAIELGLPIEENIVTDSEKRCVIFAQRKLLEYLIENRFSGISQHSTDERVYLKQLLRQLGEQ